MAENYGFAPITPHELPPEEVEALDRLARELSGRLGGEWALTAWRRDMRPAAPALNPLDELPRPPRESESGGE